MYKTPQNTEKKAEDGKKNDSKTANDYSVPCEGRMRGDEYGEELEIRTVENINPTKPKETSMGK